MSGLDTGPVLLYIYIYIDSSVKCSTNSFFILLNIYVSSTRFEFEFWVKMVPKFTKMCQQSTPNTDMVSITPGLDGGSIGNLAKLAGN